MSQFNTGFLEVICGPMFCGKTEELIRRVRRAIIAKKQVLVFKHQLDTRYVKRNLMSHSKISHRSKVVKSAKDILKKITPRTQVVAIDEAMLFGTELITVVEKLVNQGKRVIVSGLSSTFDAQPFEPIPSLLAVADRVDKLSAVCNNCGKEAIFHKKLTNNHIDALAITAKHVGEKDIYEARCRQCFNLD